MGFEWDTRAKAIRIFVFDDSLAFGHDLRLKFLIVCGGAEI